MPQDLLTFGVDDTIPLSDQKIVTHAVMINMDCRLDDREVQVARPAYEYALLKARYSMRGGSVTVMTNWLVNPKNNSDAHPRTVPLSRSTLLAEMARCQNSFKMLTAKGEHSIFEKVYGKGGDNRFIKVVNSQIKLWKQINADCKTKGRQPTLEELQSICDLGLPPVEGVMDIEEVTLDDEATTGPIEQMDADDPVADLMNYLTGEGVDPSVSLAVAEMHGSGGLNKGKLVTLPELVQKPDAIRDVIAKYEAWKAKQQP